MNWRITCGTLVLLGATLGAITILITAPAGTAADPAQPGKPVIHNFSNQTPLPWMKSAPTGKAVRSGAARTTSPAVQKVGRVTAAPSRAQPAAASVRTTQPAAALNGDDYDPPAKVRTGRTHEITLDAGVTKNVPKTPEEVSEYLKTMKEVISDYQDLASQTLLSGTSGQKLSPESLATARQQTVEMIQTIRSVSPPRELSDAHNQLATTLADVGTFMESGANGGGLKVLAQMGPLMGQFKNTIERYHRGVRNCIAYYQLDPSLDPFSGENKDTKAQISGLYDMLKGNMMKQPGGASSDGSQADGGGGGGMDLGGLAGLLGGAGGGLDPGKLGSMKDMNGIDFGSILGGSGGGGGGIDAGALGGMLGGGGGGIDAGALGGMLGGGGAGGALGGSCGGGGGGMQMPDLTDPDTQNKMNDVFKLLQSY